MRKYSGIFTACLFLFCFTGISQDRVLPLWRGTIPDYRDIGEKEHRDTTDIVRISKVQKPDIAVFLPSKSNIISYQSPLMDVQRATRLIEMDCPV